MAASDKPARPSALPVKLEGVPNELKSKARWMLWDYTWQSGKWRKVPYKTDRTPASSTNPETWTSYDEVVAAYKTGRFDGLGFALGEEKGIDLDDCIDPITDEMSALAKETLAAIEGYAEVSPSGTGLKLFTRGTLDRSRKDDAKGIEIYGQGRYFTVTGHQVNGHERMPSADQPLGDFILKHFGEEIKLSPTAGDESDLAFYKAPLTGWPLEKVEAEILALLDPDCGYDEWMQVGMALHHQGEGDESWLYAWDSWSQGSGKYDEGYCEAKWLSFSEQRFSGAGAVTLASLIHKTSEVRRELTVSTRDSFTSRINAASDEKALRGEVLPAVRHDITLEDVDREHLARALQTKWRALVGTPMKLDDARKLVKKERARHNDDAHGAPPWARPWVFCTDKDRFFNLDTGESVSITGFNMMHDRHMAAFMDADGNIPNASHFCKTQWDVPTVAGVSYMPDAGPVFEMLGVQWANCYSDRDVPTTPPVLTDAEEAAIDKILRHVEKMFPDQREREIFISWLAYNIRNPGKKIRWAPFIYGAPGVGKSFFLNLLGMTMGADNVAPLDAGTVCNSDFTGWAVGAAVRCIEEVKLHGHNAHDVTNKLKQFLTNTIIDVHAKGRDPYRAINTTNYLALSNYIDGMPVEKGDRRYCVLHAAMTAEEAEVLAASGYFEDLFGAIEHFPGAVRKYFLECPLHPEFNPDGQAPMTEAKAVTIELSKSNLHLAAEGVIEAGAEGVTKDILSSGCLAAKLEELTGDKVYTKSLNTLLSNLGFRFFDRIKWKGWPHRIWVSGKVPKNATRDEVRSALDAAGFEEDFLK